jgi:nucleoside-diphosphate-sugar epimerase
MDVAILGCGYVGLDLGRRLLDAGHDVIGVRRSNQGLRAIREVGMRAIQADVTRPETLEAIPRVDALVFAASSGGRGASAARSVYVDGLRSVIAHFGSRSTVPERLVYTSSTGVYGDHEGAWVDEETSPDPTTEKTGVLLEAENVARGATDVGMRPTVLRFAGLYGPDRYRVERYVDGPVRDGYLNMIHRADAADSIRFVLEHPSPPSVLLAVDNEPVDRWVFANWLADQCGLPRPEKETVEERLHTASLSSTAERRLRTSKRCSNDQLRSLGYTFQYPTFREGYEEVVATYRDTQ